MYFKRKLFSALEALLLVRFVIIHTTPFTESLQPWRPVNRCACDMCSVAAVASCEHVRL